MIVVDWPLIREWYAHLWDEERYIASQDQAEYEAAPMEMDMMHEAGHPHDVERYDITKPMPLPEPWDVVPDEHICTDFADTLDFEWFNEDEILND